MLRSLFITFMILSASSFACSCMEWSDARSMLQNADTVVLAVPVSDSQIFDPDQEYAPIMQTTMKVVKHYKGKYKKTFQLLSEKGDGANCGLTFEKYDGLFLFFGHKYNSDYYMTTICGTGYVSPENEEVLSIIDQLEKM